MKIMTMHFWSGRDTLKSRLLKHTLFLSSGTVITSFFAYLFRITCVQTMPVEDYGKLALFLTIYVNLIIIAHLNLGTPMTKYVSEYMVKDVARIPSLYLSALTIAIFSSLLAFIVSIVIFEKYDLLSLVIAVCLFFSFFLFATYRVNAGFLQGLQKMKRVGALSASLGVSRFALLIIFIFLLHGLSIESALIAYFSGIYITAILSFFLALRLFRVKRLPWRARLSSLEGRVNKSTIKLIATFSAYIVPRNLLSTSLMALIPVFLLSRTNFANVAYFDVALLIYSIPTLLLSSLNISLIPMVSENEARDRPINYSQILRRLILYAVCVLAVLYSMFYVGVDALFTKLIFGEQFLPSVSLVRILFLALPFQVYYTAVSSFLVGMGKPGATLKITILTFLISLPLYIIMIMQKGIYGAAVIFAVTQMLFSIFAWRELRKNTK